MGLSFKIKCILAAVFDLLGLNGLWLRCLNRKYGNNYIRIVNYHFSPAEQADAFERQVCWLLDHFENCDYAKLEAFLSGQYRFASKPGVMFTFDDGYLENFTVAHPILRKHGATGWYMISSGMVGKKNYVGSYGWPMDYMDAAQLRTLLERGEVIACHTHSHHRMDVSDTPEILQKEIPDAKAELEALLNAPVDIFCWCGGEEDTYTKKAADYIRTAGFKYGFMTCSAPILQTTDHFQLDRTNIEPDWPMSLLRFQTCGPTDLWFRAKRHRVHELTR